MVMIHRLAVAARATATALLRGGRAFIRFWNIPAIGKVDLPEPRRGRFTYYF